MAKYGKKAQKKVKRALHKRKRGYAEKRRLRQESEEPQTGYRNRPVGSSQGRREGAAEEERR